MVLKYKSNSIYKLLIPILIGLLILMLYLGNYNLIEGNSTEGNSTSQVISKLDSLLESNKNIAQGLEENKMFDSACSSIEKLNKKHMDSIIEEGGLQTFGADTKIMTAQATATLCSKNQQ